MRGSLLALFTLLGVACGEPEMRAPVESGPFTAEVSLDEKRVASGGVGELIVVVERAEGEEVSWELPEVAGLEVTAGALELREDGDLLVEVQRLELAGEDGGYIVPAINFTGSSGESVASPEIFFDIGHPVASSELVGLSAAPPPLPSPWPRRLTIVGLALGGLLLLAAIARRLLRRTSAPKPPPPPGDEALAALEALIADHNLDSHARAMALSFILRRLLERSVLSGALAMTSGELQLALDRGEPLIVGNSERSKLLVGRLLEATDLIKYAGDAAEQGLFEELYDALREIVAGVVTRLRHEAERREAEKASRGRSV